MRTKVKASRGEYYREVGKELEVHGCLRTKYKDESSDDSALVRRDSCVGQVDYKRSAKCQNAGETAEDLSDPRARCVGFGNVDFVLFVPSARETLFECR